MVSEALREYRQGQRLERVAAGPRWQDRNLVFISRLGTALDGRNVTRFFQAAVERAGLPRKRFHDLRHACATLLIEQGEDLAVVSRMLGHSNLSTTADVYAHLTRAMQQRAADRMDFILRRSEAG
jgi:integrase